MSVPAFSILSQGALTVQMSMNTPAIFPISSSNSKRVHVAKNPAHPRAMTRVDATRNTFFTTYDKQGKVLYTGMFVECDGDMVTVVMYSDQDGGKCSGSSRISLHNLGITWKNSAWHPSGCYTLAGTQPTG